MSGNYGGPARHVVDGEPDQVLRLHRFRAAHPAVAIGPAEFGTWQARIPEPNGETVLTRHLLRELLDKLDSLDAAASGEPPVQAG
jgi:hypothetical protein